MYTYTIISLSSLSISIWHAQQFRATPVPVQHQVGCPQKAARAVSPLVFLPRFMCQQSKFFESEVHSGKPMPGQ